MGRCSTKEKITFRVDGITAGNQESAKKEAERLKHFFDHFCCSPNSKVRDVFESDELELDEVEEVIEVNDDI